MAIPSRLQGAAASDELLARALLAPETLGALDARVALDCSAVSFVTSPLHVPLRRLFKDAKPEDGIEACATAWRADFGEETQEPESDASQGVHEDHPVH